MGHSLANPAWLWNSWKRTEGCLTQLPLNIIIPDLATWIICKFCHIALTTNFATRWDYLHQLWIWPPGSATFFATLLMIDFPFGVISFLLISGVSIIFCDTPLATGMNPGQEVPYSIVFYFGNLENDSFSARTEKTKTLFKTKLMQHRTSFLIPRFTQGEAKEYNKDWLLCRF